MLDRDATVGTGLIAALVRSGYRRFRYRAAVHRLVGRRPAEVQAIARAGRYGTPVPPVPPARRAPMSVARRAAPDKPADAEPRRSPGNEVRPTNAPTIVASAVHTPRTEAPAASPPARHLAPTAPAHAAVPELPSIRRTPDGARCAPPPVVEHSSTVTAGAPATDLVASAPRHRSAAPPAVTDAVPRAPHAVAVSHVAPPMPRPAATTHAAAATLSTTIAPPAGLRTAAGPLPSAPARAATSATSGAAFHAEAPVSARAHPARTLDAARAPSPAPAAVNELAAPHASSTALARHGQPSRVTAERAPPHVPAGLDPLDPLGRRAAVPPLAARAAIAPLAARLAAPPRSASADAKLHGSIAELAREVAALRQGQRESAARAAAAPPEPAQPPARQVRAARAVQPPSDASWARRDVGLLRFRVSR